MELYFLETINQLFLILMKRGRMKIYLYE